VVAVRGESRLGVVAVGERYLFLFLVRRSAQYCTSPYDGASMCQPSVRDA